MAKFTVEIDDSWTVDEIIDKVTLLKEMFKSPQESINEKVEIDESSLKDLNKE